MKNKAKNTLSKQNNLYLPGSPTAPQRKMMKTHSYILKLSSVINLMPDPGALSVIKKQRPEEKETELLCIPHMMSPSQRTTQLCHQP